MCNYDDFSELEGKGLELGLLLLLLLLLLRQQQQQFTPPLSSSSSSSFFPNERNAHFPFPPSFGNTQKSLFPKVKKSPPPVGDGMGGILKKSSFLSHSDQNSEWQIWVNPNPRLTFPPVYSTFGIYLAFLNRARDCSMCDACFSGDVGVSAYISYMGIRKGKKARVNRIIVASHNTRRPYLHDGISNVQIRL